jgi:nicotinamidase-related amidase
MEKSFRRATTADMLSPRPSPYAFWAIDVEKDFTPREHHNTNKKISIVADDFRQIGIPIYWFTFPYPSQRSGFKDIYIARPDTTRDIHLTKRDASAFERRMKERLPPHTQHLIICGYNASVCILHTIKDALKQGYEVTLLSDCTNYAAIDYDERKISYRHLFLDRMFYGKDVFGKLQRAYPNQFHLKTHLEFAADFEQETGIKTRLLSLRDHLHPQAQKGWTYESL